MTARALAAAALINLSSLPLAYSQPAQEKPAMSSNVNEAADPAVAQALAAYDQSRTAAALNKAADAAALHDGEAQPDPAAALQAAHARVADWLAILSRFKRDLDPDFDPDNPPSRMIRPPGELGLQYGVGVKPSDVKDPALRQAYVEAIAANEEKLRRFGDNVQLSKAHAIIRERAATSLQDAHATLGLPAADLSKQVAAANLQPADRDALLAIN